MPRSDSKPSESGHLGQFCRSSESSDARNIMIAPLPSRPVSRVAFLGTPEIAAGVLQALVDESIEVTVVVTREDKRRGRGSTLNPSPVKVVAESCGVTTVHSLDDLLAEHRRNPVELGVVVAFGRIITLPILEKIPMVNLHMSMLPRWRGAAPIERAILAGDDTTGVCLMQVEEGLDTGGVISSSIVSMDRTMTAEQVRQLLMEEGIELLLGALRTGHFETTPQQGDATYAAKIDASERHIDWSESADMVLRRVRIGGAWTEFRGRRMKIHEVQLLDADNPSGRIILRDGDPIVGCGIGSVQLVEVQSEGRPRVRAREWARGVRWTGDDSMEDA